jgi:hypothetical protein
MVSDARNRPAGRLVRSISLVVGIAGASVLASAPIGAQAASRSRDAASICSKVSAAAVSAIVGYTVPAPTGLTLHEKPTAANYGISGVTTICTFGAETSVAALKKDVSLSLEITSRPLTAQEVMTVLAKSSSATLKVTVAAYSGLGVPGVYLTESGAGTRGHGILGLAGTSYFSASVETPLSMSKLASLAKLARTL